jgi:4'-phosphopantetheinyl transferase
MWTPRSSRRRRLCWCEAVPVYWLEQCESNLPPNDEWLSKAESAFLNQLRSPKRRGDWRLGRWTAKRAIAAHRRLPQDLEALTAIEVRPMPSGAPEAFVEGRLAGLSLSLSHSHGTAFCAIAEGGVAVGCDVEKVEPRSPAFLADYFTIEEQRAVARSPGDQRDRVLTLFWSVKESVLKVLQSGLREDTRSVFADPAGILGTADGQWQRVRAGDTAGRTFHGWWRQTGDFVWTLFTVPPPLEPLPLILSGRLENQPAVAPA